MVAIQIKANKDTGIACPSCEESHVASQWRKREVVQVGERASYPEDGYYWDFTTWDMWEAPCCYAFFTEDEFEERKGDGGGTDRWQCSGCEAEWDSFADAVRCCE